MSNIVEAGGQVLVIEIAGAEYGIATGSIKEIARMVATTPVPEAPAFVTGAIDYRGELVIVVDLGARLALQPARGDIDSYIVIVTHEGRSVGVLVDTVREVITLDEDYLMAAPERLPLPEKLVAGAYETNDRMLLVLNIAPVLDFSDSALLKKLKQPKKASK